MKDPVCGMEVNEEDARTNSLYNGRVYLFCSEECKKKFLQNPDSYVKQAIDEREEMKREVRQSQ